MMKITCIMMQKNEHHLLEPWILYHGLLFGLDNLYVYDNGSTDQYCIDTLDKYELLGLNVCRNFLKKSDFENKGHIFSEKIKYLDKHNPSDFYFPMDCDEFMVAEESKGNISVGKDSIFRSLSPYLNSTAPLAIATAFDNNPVKQDYYYRAEGQRKTFFSKGTCWTLDLGFHDGKTKTKEAAIKTPVSYVHFHYKSFSQYVESAVQKLEGRVEDFSMKSLKAFSEKKLAGFHLVGTLLGGRDKYYLNHYNRFKKLSKSFYELKDFNRVMSSLKLDYSDLNPNLLKAFDKGIPRWKGYIDSLEVGSGCVKLKGWIVSLYNFNLEDIVLSISGKKLKLSNYEFISRQDVERKVDFASKNSGVELIFATRDRFKDINSNEIEIYLDDHGTRFDFSFSGKLVQTN